MADYGLTLTGFVPKTVEVIRAEINADLRSEFGTTLDLSDSDPLGHLVGIVSSLVAEQWELQEAVYNSRSRDTATGAQLDDVLLLTGTFRQEATPSTGRVILTGIPTTVIPAGTQIASSTTGIVFETDIEDEIDPSSTWLNSQPYVVDEVVTNSSRIYICITAGTSAGSGGPTTTSSDITDGTVHWRYVGEGTGWAYFDITAVETGPQEAISGDLTDIVTPVGDLLSAMNVTDITLGTDLATDAEARIQGELDLAATGEGTVDAIRQELLAVDGVTSATIFVNNTDTTDADGVPPHSIEAMVEGGDDQDIWNALLGVVSATTGTHGDETGTATDEAGYSHTMNFSRPDLKNVYVTITLIKDAATYPTDGDAQVKAAIVAFGDAQLCGKNVVASSIGAQAFKVAGVLDVTSTLISVSPTTVPVASTTIAIALRELAVFDTARITVVTSNGTP